MKGVNQLQGQTPRAFPDRRNQESKRGANTAASLILKTEDFLVWAVGGGGKLPPCTLGLPSWSLGPASVSLASGKPGPSIHGRKSR